MRLLFFAFQGVIDYVKKEKFRAEGSVQSEWLGQPKSPEEARINEYLRDIIGENPSTKLVGAEEEPLRKVEYFL